MTPSALQWVVTANVLGSGGFLLLGGRLADLFNRKKLLIAGLGRLRCGQCRRRLRDLGLIGARFAKGVSAAFTAPASSRSCSICTAMRSSETMRSAPSSPSRPRHPGADRRRVGRENPEDRCPARRHLAQPVRRCHTAPQTARAQLVVRPGRPGPLRDRGRGHGLLPPLVLRPRRARQAARGGGARLPRTRHGASRHRRCAAPAALARHHHMIGPSEG